MENVATGSVVLAGAGPGHPGLITWRALECLAGADAVCFDALVDPTLIVTLPERVERHYVGKRAGIPSMKQDAINDLLIHLARAGKRVVRLKGGDPYIFGRGGEEAIALREAGIPFEVVPGVTAAAAATASAGFPLTHRGLAAFATLFTAHDTLDKDESENLDYATIARLTRGTVVGYMGIGRLHEVCTRLVEEGADPSLPAAVIERGATGRQRVVRSTLQHLAEDVDRAGLHPPGLLVIGRTVDLIDRIGAAPAGPLAGKRVLVTRPAHQAGEMYDLLRAVGATMVPIPSIHITSRIDEDAWIRFQSWLDGVTRLCRNDPSGDYWLAFTSENGVRCFLEKVRRFGDWRDLGGFRIAAVGTGTGNELNRWGFKPDFIPSKATVATFGVELAPKLAPGARVIRVRGNLGDTTLEDTLRRAGTEVLPLPVYETTTAPLDDGHRAWLADGPIHIIAFTSGSTATGFVEQWGRDKALAIAASAVVASIGPSTTGEAQKLGLKVTVEATEHHVPGLVRAIIRWAESQ